MNKAEHIARLRAELKALEAEVEDPIYKRAQEILDIMFPDRKTWKENEKYLPSNCQCDEYHGAKVYWVNENHSDVYYIIGFMYRDRFYGRDEETEYEVPKLFFETDNLKEEIYNHFFQINKKEMFEGIKNRIYFKSQEVEKLRKEISKLENELVEAKEEWGDE